MNFADKVEVKYVILWGQKDLNNRKKTTTSDYYKAKQIFDDVQKDHHADVFKVTTSIVSEKLT